MQDQGHDQRLALSELVAKFARHGGQISTAARMFPDAPRPLIDLSTGINPHGWPVPELAASLFQRLPDAGEAGDLERVAARAYGVDVPPCVVAVPGTQALIQRLPALMPARSVGILGPTYSGHAGAWSDAGTDVADVQSLTDLHGFDVAVVVNPNNPDGRVLSRAEIVTLSRANGQVIVDEAFMDFLPKEASFAGLAGLHHANVTVLRSFGKAYGLAGIRLGFAVCRPELAGAVRRSFGDWAVSGPALHIGTAALADESWQKGMARRVLDDSARLALLLKRSGWEDRGGTCLFRLVEHDQAQNWFVHLLELGILSRPFAPSPRLLRFGLPTGEDQWQRLEQGLSTGQAVGRHQKSSFLTSR